MIPDKAYPETTRTECPCCAHETIVGSNVDVFCHSCGEVYSVEDNISPNVKKGDSDVHD